jgi:hypothetical protein
MATPTLELDSDDESDSSSRRRAVNRGARQTPSKQSGATRTRDSESGESGVDGDEDGGQLARAQAAFEVDPSFENLLALQVGTAFTVMGTTISRDMAKFSLN